MDTLAKGEPGLIGGKKREGRAGMDWNDLEDGTDGKGDSGRRVSPSWANCRPQGCHTGRLARKVSDLHLVVTLFPISPPALRSTLRKTTSQSKVDNKFTQKIAKQWIRIRDPIPDALLASRLP